MELGYHMGSVTLTVPLLSGEEGGVSITEMFKTLPNTPELSCAELDKEGFSSLVGFQMVYLGAKLGNFTLALSEIISVLLEIRNDIGGIMNSISKLLL